MASRTSPPGTDSSPVVDIEDFVVESSVGWRNGSGQASPPVQYRQRDVRGISGGEGVDGPAGGGRSSFEVSVPQQRGDEQNEGGHDSLAQNELGGEPNVELCALAPASACVCSGCADARGGQRRSHGILRHLLSDVHSCRRRRGGRALLSDCAFLASAGLFTKGTPRGGVGC